MILIQDSTPPEQLWAVFLLLRNTCPPMADAT